MCSLKVSTLSVFMWGRRITKMLLKIDGTPGEHSDPSRISHPRLSRRERRDLQLATEERRDIVQQRGQLQASQSSMHRCINQIGPSKDASFEVHVHIFERL